jgi:hypothetical protein
LKKKLRIEAAQNLLLALLCLAGGLVVLTVTFFFTYAVVWLCVNHGASALSQLVANKRLHVTHPPILITCSIFLFLLFIGNARTSREYLSNYTVAPPSLALIRATGVGGLMLVLLANRDASGKMITDLFYTGPRLIVGAVKALLRSSQVMAMDMSGCAHALALLEESPQRVPCTELAEQLAGHNVVRVFSELHEMDGVLFLNTAPPPSPSLTICARTCSTGSAFRGSSGIAEYIVDIVGGQRDQTIVLAQPICICDSE